MFRTEELSTKCDFVDVTKEWLAILLHMEEGSGSTYRVKDLCNAHNVFLGICKYRTSKHSRALRIKFSSNDC